MNKILALGIFTFGGGVVGNEEHGQESRREEWTDARSAVGFCLGSGLFGSYNSD